MTESEFGTRAIAHIERDMVKAANWACTLAVINLIVLPFGFVNPIALVISLLIGWRAWCNGARSMGLHKRFDVGSSYVTSARIGIWLGGFSFAVATILALLAMLQIVLSG